MYMQYCCIHAGYMQRCLLLYNYSQKYNVLVVIQFGPSAPNWAYMKILAKYINFGSGVSGPSQGRGTTCITHLNVFN